MQFDWLSDLAPAHAAQDSWRRGDYARHAVWHVVYAPDASFAVACGAALLAGHVRRFRFTPDVIERIGRDTDARGHSRFDESFLNHLQRLQLRVDVWAAHEGAVLLPGEPVAVLAGPLLQLHLLESAATWLLGQSTRWATGAAQARLRSGDLHEETAPTDFEFTAPNPAGWRQRARFIGGAPAALAGPDAPEVEAPGFLQAVTAPDGAPLRQIRRLFDGARPLGDVWLTAAHEQAASVTQTRVEFTDRRSGRRVSRQITRFQPLYHPLLLKGHAVWEDAGPEYARQRTLQHLAGFRDVGFDDYTFGWFDGG